MKLMTVMMSGSLGFDQNVRDGEARVGDVLEGSLIGGVSGRDAEQAAAGDGGDADDDAAMLIQLEPGSKMWIAQLRELRILDDDEGVLAIDVFNFSEFRWWTTPENWRAYFA